MRWLNAGAWVGLLALAIPVLVHLLNRHRARVQQFPTLRFLDVAPVTPVRRTRLSDIPLLLLRATIVAVAVAALAQPLFFARARDVLGTHVVRAVIVDTSASVQRAAVGQMRAVQYAMREATRLADGATEHLVLPVSDPASAIAGASAWLATRSGRSEIVIVSDFQRGQIAQSDFASVAPHVGIRLVRVNVGVDSAPIDVRTHALDREQGAHVAATRDGTDVEWTVQPAADRAAGADSLILLAGSSEQTAANAARDAARTVTALPGSVAGAGEIGQRIAVVYPQFANRSTLLREGAAIDIPWMADIVAEARRDSSLADAARAEMSAFAADSLTPHDARYVVVARSETGAPLMVATRARIDDHDVLLVVSAVAPGTRTSVAMIAALLRARVQGEPSTELERAFESDANLRAWERPADETRVAGTAPDSSASDGRWVWLLVLALLGVEAWMRRERGMQTTGRIGHVA